MNTFENILNITRTISISVLFLGLSCKDAPSADSKDPTYAVEVGSILFVSTNRNPHSGAYSPSLLYSMMDDGSNIRPVFGDSLVPVSDARWSSDGSKIIVVSPILNTLTHIETFSVLDLKSGRISQLQYRDEDSVYPLVGSNPVWSPDSRRIVFSSQVGPEAAGIQGMFIYDLNNQTVEALDISGSISKRINDWAVDGKGFVGDIYDWSLRDSVDRPLENTRVAFFDLSGSILRTWGTLGNVHYNPVYSRSGSHIAFTSNGGTSSQGIYMLPINGSMDSLLVTPVHRYNWAVEWSPDDKYLLYNAGSDLNFGKILIIDKQSKQIKDITPFPSDTTYSRAVSWK